MINRLFPLLTVTAFLACGSLACGSTRGMTREQNMAYDARKQLTRQLVARAEWQTAFAYADELHRQQPEDAEVLALRGIVYRERNMPGEAEADLRAALAIDDKNAEAHAALGIVLDSTQRGLEAETHHKRAVALEGKNPGYLNNLGFSQLLRRKNKEALETLQKAARLSPTNPRIRTNVGFAYAAVGDFPRAAKEFDMGASPAEAKNNLGFAYEKRGDLHNAFELYVDALRVDPGCAKARSNLSHLSQRLGKPLPADIQAQASSASDKPREGTP